jgi:S1-C subfamily serine protease
MMPSNTTTNRRPPERGAHPLPRFAALASALALSAATVLPTFSAPSVAAAQELSEQRRIEVARRLQESTVSVISGPSTGSGFITGEERWVVTNSHVIRPGGRSGVRVHFSSGTTRAAEVLLDSPSHDLAVLRVVGDVPARPLTLGDSDRVEVGQNVLAFGSPFGLEGTLTQGIVSAIRDVPPGSSIGGGAVQRVIQTDAPINPGNSGGPLVGANGDVIGVTTAILSRTGGSHGIGFAVPSNHVRDLLSAARQRVRVARAEPSPRPSPGDAPVEVPADPRARAEAGPAFLGILGDDFRSRRFAGVRIRQVVPGSPADAAGLAGAADPAPPAIEQLGVEWTGHIIVAVDGRPSRSMDELQRLLGRHRPGDRAVLTVTVGPGVLSGQAVVTLAARPDE